MGDIKFKISGSTAPFLAQLWDSGCSTVLQQKSVEYSGRTTIFCSLEPNTCYHLNITDNINKSISKSYTTPMALIPPVLPTKNITLLGTLSTNAGYSQTINSPKYVSITPPLSGDESIDLKFNVQTINNKNTSNNIELFCNNTSISQYSNSGSMYRCVNVKYGDTLSYNISTVVQNSTNADGCSILDLTGTTGIGVLTNIVSPSILTTKMKIEPIVVGLCNTNAIISLSEGYVSVVPQLTTGQELEIFFGVKLFDRSNAKIYLTPNGSIQKSLVYELDNLLSVREVNGRYTTTIGPNDLITYVLSTNPTRLNAYSMLSLTGASGDGLVVIKNPDKSVDSAGAI